MWRATYCALGSVFDVVAADDWPRDELTSLFATYEEGHGPAVFSYELAMGPPFVLRRAGAELYGGDDPRDVVAKLELDLYERAVERASASWVLHAAAVARGGGAVLLAGGSGVGKSTMALALAGAGARYLTDEFAAVGPDGSVTGIRRALSFDAEPVAPLPSGASCFERRLRVVRGGESRTTVVTLPPALLQDGPVPAAALVSLTHDATRAASLAKLTPGEALTRLWPCSWTRDAERLPLATRLVAQLPAFALTTRNVERARDLLLEILDRPHGHGGDRLP